MQYRVGKTIKNLKHAPGAMPIAVIITNHVSHLYLERTTNHLALAIMPHANKSTHSPYNAHPHSNTHPSDWIRFSSRLTSWPEPLQAVGHNVNHGSRSVFPMLYLSQNSQSGNAVSLSNSRSMAYSFRYVFTFLATHTSQMCIDGETEQPWDSNPHERVEGKSIFPLKQTASSNKILKIIK